MMKNVDKTQADRIFRACDTSGDNRISLEEFRKMVERGKDDGGGVKPENKDAKKPE